MKIGLLNEGLKTGLLNEGLLKVKLRSIRLASAASSSALETPNKATMQRKLWKTFILYLLY